MKFLEKILLTFLAVTLFVSCSDDDDSAVGSAATISLSSSVLQTEEQGGDVTVTVTSSGDWRIAGVCDWVRPSVTSGKSGDVVTFTVDANDINEYRCSTFKFFTGSAVAPLKIESHPGYMLELLSEATVSLSKAKSSVTVQLNTNIKEPTITFNDGGESWIKFVKRTEFAGKVNYTFDVAENATYKDRNSVISIASPFGDDVANITVNQAKTEAVLVEGESLVFDMSARSISFDVKYNIDYKVNVVQGQDWITDKTVTEPQLGEDGLNTVTVSYKLAEATSARAGVIRFAKLSDGDIVKEISVIQKDPNAPLIEIPDKSLYKICKNAGWILPVEGTKCLVLEEGLKATRFSNNSWGTALSDLTGLENFPNLTTLDLGYCTDMKKLDISGLHKVTSVTSYDFKNCEVFNLGDNPITSFNIGGEWGYSYVSSLTFISTKVETMDLHLHYWAASNDYVTSVDVSECPALKTLNIERGDNLKTLYLKKGQEIPNLKKKESTVIEYK